MRVFLLILGAALAACSVRALPAAAGPAERPVIGGPVSPDGKCYVAVNLPADQRIRNVGGADGAGLCVFTATEMQARLQNERRLFGLQKAMKAEAGGGWPEKFEVMVNKYGKGTQYIQYLEDDPAFLEFALSTGRMPSVTYNGNHMLSLLFLNEKWACVLDNNFIGENELRWHSREEFLSLWRKGGQPWAIVLIAPRPPAPPRNLKEGGA